MTTYDLVDVTTIGPGDYVNLRTIGPVLVADVERYDDVYVVVYFSNEEASYENRARDKSGTNVRQRRVLKTLAQRRPGDLLEVERGNPTFAAAELEALHRDEAERWHATDTRRRHAAARDASSRRDIA